MIGKSDYHKIGMAAENPLLVLKKKKKKKVGGARWLLSVLSLTGPLTQPVLSAVTALRISASLASPLNDCLISLSLLPRLRRLVYT